MLLCGVRYGAFAFRPTASLLLLQDLPLSTENEEKFHRNYQSLYRQLKTVYDKIGATEFSPAIREPFDPVRHEKVVVYRIFPKRRAHMGASRIKRL